MMIKNPYGIDERKWPDYALADPFLLRHDGWYYLYGTAKFGQGVECWKSEDLVGFEYLGQVCDIEELHNAFAPEVIYSHGKFYMMTSPKGNGHYILESDQPDGPFEMTGPNIGQSIDGSVFIDDDGSMYFYRAGFKGIMVHKMDSTTSIRAKGQMVENSSLDHWTEGPMVIKRDGLYYMTVTGNHFLSRGYRVAYLVSDQGPDRGFKKLDESILLLETMDQRFGLGHSANVLAPDMSGDLIVYHHFEWIGDKGIRGLNIDRLFRNKARLSANSTWWTQPEFSMPDQYGRGLKRLGPMTIEGGTPLEDQGYGIYEWNSYGLPKDGYTFYDDDKEIGNLIYGQDQDCLSYICKIGDLEIKGTCPKNVCPNGLITTRVQVVHENLKIWVNDLYVGGLSFIGRISSMVANQGNPSIGFCAYTGRRPGDFEVLEPKAIPGRIDGAFCLGHEPGHQEYTKEDAGSNKKGYELDQKEEKGFVFDVVKILDQRPLTYKVTIKENGYYRLFVNLKRPGQDQWTKTYFGTRYLCKSQDQIELTFEAGSIIDYLEWILVEDDDLSSGQASQSQTIVGVHEGLMNPDHFKALTQKGRGGSDNPTLMTKLWGLGCCANRGMGFMGKVSDMDYTYRVVIRRDAPDTGEIGLYVRASKESFYEAQVRQSLIGYGLVIKDKHLTLSKLAYDSKPLAGCELCSKVDDGLESEYIKIDIECSGPNIRLLVDDRELIVYTDSKPYLYGKVGLEVLGEGQGIVEASLHYHQEKGAGQ